MGNKKITNYDLTDFYKTDIYPKILEIKKQCKIHGLPFFCACAPFSSEKETKYEYETNLTGSNNIVLKDDKFETFLGVIVGLPMVPIATKFISGKIDADYEAKMHDIMTSSNAVMDFGKAASDYIQGDVDDDDNEDNADDVYIGDI
jgi:hypothetical protein